MPTEKLLTDFNSTIDLWIREVGRYSFAQLTTRPSPGSWSLGQVGMHLVGNTNYYISQIQICIGTDEHADGEATAEGKTMFRNNAFPDVLIEGPPSNGRTPQPESPEHLLRDLANLKEEMHQVYRLISASSFRGKTKHPGLHYFSAREWFQFAEMHLRHHLRQKERIDRFLLSSLK